MFTGKELTIRVVVGAVVGGGAVLLYRGWPSSAEHAATIVVAGVTVALAVVMRGLGLRRSIALRQAEQQSGSTRRGLDPVLWTIVGLVFVVFVALFLWLMVSAAGNN